MGAPERPALSAFPVLGAIAATTRTVHFGPLVARVGLVPDRGAGRGAVVAGPDGTGTPDRRARHRGQQERGREPRLRDPLHRARRAPVGAARLRVRTLLGSGVPVWVGGGRGQPTSSPWSSARRSTCGRASPPRWRGLQPRCEVTWAGPVAGDAARIAQWLQELADRRRHLGGVRLAGVARGRGRGGRLRARLTPMRQAGRGDEG